MDDKVRGRDVRESSPQSGRRLRGGKVTGRKETRGTETGQDVERERDGSE